MKRLILLAALIATPAFAEETKPPVWMMVVQFKASSIMFGYQAEAMCRSAVKLIVPHLKKSAGVAECLPVLQQ